MKPASSRYDARSETQVARLLLHGLGLSRTANAGHGDAHVDCRALTLVEQFGLQVDLTIGNRDDVGRNVRGDVAILRLDDRQSREGATAVLLGELAGALEQTRVQVEDVAGGRLRVPGDDAA